MIMGGAAKRLNVYTAMANMAKGSNESLHMSLPVTDRSYPEVSGQLIEPKLYCLANHGVGFYSDQRHIREVSFYSDQTLMRGGSRCGIISGYTSKRRYNRGKTNLRLGGKGL